MNINFAPMDGRCIKAKVKAGYYSNATEMVRDAIRRMREQEDRLLAALEIGDREMASGHTVPYSRNLLSHIELEARVRAAKNIR